MAHIWFCSAWKFNLKGSLDFFLDFEIVFHSFCILMDFLSFCVISVWLSKECDFTFSQNLCISSKQSSGLNEAFTSSCLHKTMLWVLAGWAQVKAKVSSVVWALQWTLLHGSSPHCVQSIRSISSSAWSYPLMASLPLCNGSDWNISNTHKRLGFQSVQTNLWPLFPWPFPHLCQN